VSRNGQRGSLLVFYVDNILVDKNTLCNGSILNRFIGFIQSLQVICTVFISSHVTGHKFLKDVNEDSMQFPSQINRFLCNWLNKPLKASGLLAMSRSFSIEDVWTSNQHYRDARSSYSKFYTELDFSRHYLGSFFKTFLKTWQHVRMLPSVPEHFGFPLQTRKGVTMKTVKTLSQTIRTWSCYGKNRVILERGSQKIVRTRLTSVRTPTCQSLNLSRIRFSICL
jgi:hypothetical protein